MVVLIACGLCGWYSYQYRWLLCLTKLRDGYLLHNAFQTSILTRVLSSVQCMMDLANPSNEQGHFLHNSLLVFSFRLSIHGTVYISTRSLEVTLACLASLNLHTVFGHTSQPPDVQKTHHTVARTNCAGSKEVNEYRHTCLAGVGDLLPPPSSEMLAILLRSFLILVV
jgi:hypothetical protein